MKWKTALAPAAALCVSAGVTLLLVAALRPSDPLLTEAAADPHLIAWLAEFNSTDSASPAVLAGEKASLINILRDSPVDARTLIEIGRAVGVRSSDDDIALAFFAAAVPRAQAELPRLDLESSRAQRILAGLSSTKNVFWRVINRQRGEYIKTLYELNQCLIHYGNIRDPEAQDARRKAFVGRVECLLLMGRNEEAADDALSISTIGMTNQEKISVAFVRGEALDKLSRPEDAIPYFQQCIGAANAPSHRLASFLLCQDFLTLNERDKATEAFGAYVQRYGMDELARSLKARLREMHADSA